MSKEITSEELSKFEEKWRELDNKGFKQILEYSKNATAVNEFHMDKEDYIYLYTLVYDILMNKNQTVIGLCEQRLYSTIKFHCQEISDKLSQNVTLELFVKKWTIFESITLNWILKVFQYLQRVKILLEKKDTLEKDLKNIFKMEIYDKYQEILKADFIQILTTFREHKSEFLDINSLRSLIVFMEYFEIEKDFLDNFINTTESYYKEKCEKQPKDSYLNYLQFGIEIIQLETVHLCLIVPAMTMTKIISDLNEIIFFTYYKELLEAQDGINSLFETGNLLFLQKTFAIYSRGEETMSVVLNYFKEFVTKRYNELIQKYELNGQYKSLSPKKVAVGTQFIDDYINLQNTFQNMIQASFMNNNIFTISLKEVLENSQGDQENLNLSYLLPYYIDKLLQKENYLEINEECIEKIKKEIEAKLGIIPYLRDLDIFFELHKNLLSKRLLFQGEEFSSCEQFILENLKKQCGEQYVQSCEKMIGDISNSKSTLEKFSVFLMEKGINFNIENSFVALDGEHWPLLNIHKMDLPPELVSISNQIYKFYRCTFKGRNLQWSLPNSNLEMNVNFPNGKFTLICNTFQGIILTLFNQIGFNKGISYEEINSKLNFEDLNDLKKALEKLIEVGLIIQNENLFFLNGGFNIQNNVLKIDSGEEGETVLKKEKIEGDRSLAIEGHIVKILKEKKSLEEEELVKMVLNNLSKFKVDSEAVVRRIGSLVNREIISRNRENPKIYEYFSTMDNEEKKDGR